MFSKDCIVEKIVFYRNNFHYTIYEKKKFANTLTTYSIYFNTNLFKFHNHQVHFYPEMHQSPKGWNKSKKVYSTRRIDESTQHGVQSDPRRTRKITKKLNKNSRKNKNLNILIGGGHFNLLTRPVADAVIGHYMHGSLSLWFEMWFFASKP